VDAFYTASYPVISSGKKTKIIIASTPLGVGNLFYRLWKGAVDGTNDYKPIMVKWDRVPGRDAEWKRQTIANTSAAEFAQEQECSFFSLGSQVTLLLPSEEILKIRNTTV
jgi:hypothetical protein